MGNTCTVCKSEKRSLVDQRLVAHAPMQVLAAEMGFSYSAVRRHKEHLGGEVLKKHEAEELAQTESLLDQVRRLVAQCQTLAKESCDAKDRRSAILALREVSRNLELLATMTGVLEGAQVHVQLNQLTVNTGAGGDPDHELATLMALITDDFNPERLAYFRQLAGLNSRTIGAQAALSDSTQ